MACEWCSLHVCIEKLLSGWASFVTSCTFLTMVLSLSGLGFIGIEYITNYQTFENEKTIYSPKVREMSPNYLSLHLS